MQTHSLNGCNSACQVSISSTVFWRPWIAGLPLFLPQLGILSFPGLVSSPRSLVSSSLLRFPDEEVVDAAEDRSDFSLLSWRVGPCPGVLLGWRNIQSFICWSGVKRLYSVLGYFLSSITQASSSALVKMGSLGLVYPFPLKGQRSLLVCRPPRTDETWRALGGSLPVC